MDISTIISLGTEIGLLIAALFPIVVFIVKIIEAEKCQLRSDMLRIYYRHQSNGTIRQYEYENFMLMYAAYKALRGNSFIDKIHDEIETWKVVP